MCLQHALSTMTGRMPG